MGDSASGSQISNEFTGIWMISFDDVDKLEVIENEEYKKIDLPEEERQYRCEIIHIKGGKIKRSNADALAIRYSEFKKFGSPKIQYEIVKLPESQKVCFASSSDVLVKYHRDIVERVTVSITHSKDGTVKNIDTHQFFYLIPHITNFGMVLSYFCYYGQGFLDLYDEYLKDPDSTITLVSEFKMENGTTPRAQKPTDIDIRVTCHLILLMLCKRFTTDENEKAKHVSQYLKKRRTAINAKLQSNGTFLIVEPGISSMTCFWSCAPKLKKMLLEWVLKNTSDFDEFSSAASLLSEAYMSNIACVIDFMTNDETKSLALTMGLVLQEGGEFLKEYNKKKAELGPLFPYYRVLEPSDTALAASAHPHLFYAAFEYCKKFRRPYYYDGMKGPKSMGGLIAESAATVDTRDIYLTRPVSKYRQDFIKLKSNHERCKNLEEDRTSNLEVLKLMAKLIAQPRNPQE